MSDEKNSTRKRPLVVLLVIIAILICFCGIFIGIFNVVGITKVYGTSMEPSLQSGQYVIFDKLSTDKLNRGDIIVIGVNQEEYLVKRLIGLPGDTIEIRDGQVFLNSESLAEPYLTESTSGIYGPQAVAPGHFFVLGDNRGSSNDSRTLGAIPREHISGRVTGTLPSWLVKYIPESASDEW